MRAEYSGELGRKITTHERRAEIERLLAMPAESDSRRKLPSSLGHLNGSLDYIVEMNPQKVSLLFTHYGIDPNNPNAWKNLALQLAIAHVPGFQVAKQPGPRRKHSAIATFLARVITDRERAGGITAKKRSGPTKWTPVMRDLLLTTRGLGEKLLRQEGVRGRITDKAALERALVYSLESTGTSKVKAKRRARSEAVNLSKRLSEFKKSIR